LKPFLERTRDFTIYNFENGTLRFNKWIFRSAFFILLLLFLAAWAADDFGDLRLMNFKISCPEKRVCDNPFNDLCEQSCANPFYHMYKYSGVVPEDIINMETLPAGFVYDNNNFFADYYKWFLLLVLGAAFLLNHLLYNRGFPFRKMFKQMLGGIE
jgi:hypothetical protein